MKKLEDQQYCYRWTLEMSRGTHNQRTKKTHQYTSTTRIMMNIEHHHGYGWCRIVIRLSSILLKTAVNIYCFIINALSIIWLLLLLFLDGVGWLSSIEMSLYYIWVCRKGGRIKRYLVYVGPNMEILFPSQPP